MSTELSLIENGALTDIKEALSKITDHHKKVSNIKTPKPYIEKISGFDYVKYPLMRDIADKEYPGWSWTVIKTEFAGTEAYVVHGRLKWFDNGVWREGDSTAAHRIQKKRGTVDYVHLGNDIKAANTDCIKKAFNMYLNICDDVYKAQIEETELTDEQRKNISIAASKLKDKNKKKEVMEQIEDGVINALNYKASMAKLERLVNE